MSNTEKVISEFLSVGENEITLLRMAEEIGRLRVENDRIRTEARVEINWLYQRAERAERILVALWYPSATIVDETRNAFDEYDGEMSGLIHHTIRAAVSAATVAAAVTAAEQEVGRE